MNTTKSEYLGLKAIALIKILRGTVALFVGIALLLEGSSLIDQYKIQVMVAERAQDPAMYLLLKFLKYINQTVIYSIGILALILAAIRYIEAIGLWHKKKWAEWLALFTTLVFIPFEIFHLTQGFNVLIVFILIVNIVICIYLLYMLQLKSLQ
jgi:uncharacterized membrane protein (DUF2068 family)